MDHRIPVICDRCHAQGLAGEADFAGLGDLLDFAPVPLQVERVDGWNPQCQRAFIAALSILGSSDRAARAVGKSAAGVERLRRLPGAEGFSRAWDRAKAISLERGTLRLAHSLKTARAAQPPADAPLGPPPPGPAAAADEEVELSEREERQKREALQRFFRHYLSRIELERTARLAGRIVEADFYVRQVTFIEVMVDLVSGDGWGWLVRARFGEPHAQAVHLVSIAETAMSRLLDQARRDYWAEGGEPERPPLPTEEQLFDHGRFKTGLQEVFWPEDGNINAQRRAKDAEYAEAARAQIAWEEKARAEAAAWRARLATEAEAPASSGGAAGQESAQAGQPAAEPTGLTSRDSLP